MRVVQLIGGAGSSAPIPALPSGGERWGLNSLWAKPALRARFEGWTRWFDLHTTAHICGRTHNVYSWECAQTKPIVRWEIDPQQPSSVAYPVGAVRTYFGHTRFFCSSFDWMLALAVYEQFTHIALYGWRMASPDYRHQVKSGQFWIRKAVDAGVEVRNVGVSSALLTRSHSVASAEPDLSRCLMYGLETTDRSKLYSHRWTT